MSCPRSSFLRVVRQAPFVAKKSVHRQLSSCASPAEYDVAIVGGGVIGSASAYFLARRNTGKKICVIEREPKYERCSTTLSVGSIRQQFSIIENIKLSQYSYEFLRDIDKHLTVDNQDPADVQLKQGSYVLLASEHGVQTLMENHALQRESGCHVSLLDRDQLRKRYPWMKTDDIAMASVGTDCEGWFDPWALLYSFKRKAASLGVEYINAEATDVVLDDNRQVAALEVTANSTRRLLTCETLVNAAGPWAGHVASLSGAYLPVEPRKRFVFVFHCPGQPVRDNVMLVDLNGAYVRPEGAGYICGMTPTAEEEPGIDDLEVNYDFFTESLWPTLAHRIPAFECLKLQGAWAGYYDYNTLDQNIIIGRHPDINNLVFANGFSGHGIQQSPAVGRAVSEIILDGGYQTIDLTNMGYERVIRNEPMKEKNII